MSPPTQYGCVAGSLSDGVAMVASCVQKVEAGARSATIAVT